MNQINRPATVAIVDPEALSVCADATGQPGAAAWYFLASGALLGVLFVKSEVISWYRIQEMFRFQSFHMYGVIAGALAVAMVAMQVVRRFDLRAWDGSPVVVPPKQPTPTGVRYWGGGTIFGLGWGLLGACPGPMFALLGAGVTAIAVAIVSAMLGTWVYAAVQPRLPH